MVFGIPGSGATLTLIDALEKRGIGFHLTRFEGTAALMAATAGRLSGQAGISLSIKGPGLANAVPGLAAAWFEAFPLVHLAEAVPNDAPAAQAHKRLAHAALTAAVTKGLRPLSEGGPGLPELAAWAEAEEPGPVVLELTDSREPAPAVPETGQTAGNSEPLVKLARRAGQPLVIAGALAQRQGWDRHLASLQIPVFSTAASKGLVDETLPQAAGVYTGAGGELTPEFNLLPRADLVVSLGLTAREVLAAKPFSAAAINVEVVPTPGKEGFAFSLDAGPGAAGPVLDALRQKSWGLEILAEVKERLNRRLDRGFLPGAIFRSVDKHFQGRVRAVMDTGYFCTIGEHAWPARGPNQCLLSGQGRYMGAGLPMALGAALHDTSLPTVAFLGDGGVGMYPAEARLAAQRRLPLLIILMTDNAFGSIRTRAIREKLTQAPLVMDGRSWVPVFDAMGIPGTRAENLPRVAAALEAWQPERGPAFLEIPFDPDRYEAMVAGIR